MADDYLLNAVLGVLQGVQSVYVPYKQKETQNALDAQKMQMQQDADLNFLQKKIPIEQKAQLDLYSRQKALETQKAKELYDYQNKNQTIGDTYPEGTVRPPEFTPDMNNLTTAQALPLITSRKKDSGLSLEDKEFQKQKARADVKKQYAMPKATASLKNLNANLDNTISQIDELLNDPKLSKATGLSGEYMSKIPGTTATDIRNKIKSIQSAISLDTLTELRAASPTGGALGQVSDAEGVRLESAKASINPNQSTPAMIESLKRLRSILVGSKQRANDAYEMDFSSVPNFGKNPNPELGKPIISPPGSDQGKARKPLTSFYKR